MIILIMCEYNVYLDSEWFQTFIQIWFDVGRTESGNDLYQVHNIM